MEAAIKFKAKGFLFSLLLGFSFFSILLLIVKMRWYPGPLFWADGGIQGLKIIFIVELVLGPVLTAYLVRVGKSASANYLDFSLLGIIQLAVFSAGAHIMYVERPVAISYYDGRFSTVSASIINMQKNGLSDLQNFGDQFPVWVYPELSASDAEQVSAFFDHKYESPIAMNHRVEYFTPAKLKWDEIKFGTSSKIRWLLLQNQPQISGIIHNLIAPKNIILIQGRYETLMANVDNDFNFLDGLSIGKSAININ